MVIEFLIFAGGFVAGAICMIMVSLHNEKMRMQHELEDEKELATAMEMMNAHYEQQRRDNAPKEKKPRKPRVKKTDAAQMSEQGLGINSEPDYSNPVQQYANPANGGTSWPDSTQR